MINISILTVPLDLGLNKKLKDNMYLTAQSLYQNIRIDFKRLHRIVKSDYIQYSPFTFENNIKISENWSNNNQELLILDIDDGLSIEEAKKRFSKYKYFICTTKSHQKYKKGVICDRFRVILEAVNIPSGDKYFKYMRKLEILFPFIDKQVNTKTGAFLGYSKCVYWYNEGISFDFDILDIKDFEKQDKPIKTNNNNNMELQQLKESITQETVRDILNNNGFDVDRNYKLTLREERTPSTSISRDCLIKDFGSDFAGDVFKVLMVYRNMTFPDAIETVRKFV